ncbi:hypothetical protein HK104_002295 [Borealophlyctis nickersoniae]|nr:hypothetical protein HK104_002295 [Borealophlyctis nickersoniae]
MTAQNEGNTPPAKKIRTVTCGRCGTQGHTKRTCTVEPPATPNGEGSSQSPTVSGIVGDTGAGRSTGAMKRGGSDVIDLTEDGPTPSLKRRKTVDRKGKSAAVPSTTPTQPPPAPPVIFASFPMVETAEYVSTVNPNAGAPETGDEQEQQSRDAQIVADDEDQAVAAQVEIGFIKTKKIPAPKKIVGLNHYRGITNKKEKVTIIREPRNPYDRNALRVDNTMNQQVGHIPRDVAAHVSPLLDRQLMRVEGTVTGDRGQFGQRIALSVIAAPDVKDQITTALARGRLVLEPPQAPKMKGKAASAAFVEAEWQRVLASGQSFTPERSQQVLEKLGISAKDLSLLPEASQPQGIVTPLLKYQKQGLRWMISAEHPELPTTDKATQFWTRRGDVLTGHYFNLATGFSTTQAPTLARGGILADDMGLGKTLQIISLIVSDPTGAGVVAKPTPPNPAFSKTTLIVCPLSVIGNWTKQIDTHVQAGKLTAYVYHGTDRNANPTFLASHDVVITTYNMLAQTDGVVKYDKARPTAGLHGVAWRRVVLDEGHIIRSRKTKQSEAAFALQAERRFVVSGTPIQNSLTDLYCIVKFLRLSPFDDYDWWNRVFARPVRNNEPEAITRLKMLMQFICVRRTKDMYFDGKPIIQLPPCHTYLYKIDFKYDDEKKTYDALQDECERKFSEFQEQNQVIDNYACILEVLMRLRQCCNHTTLLGDRKVMTMEEAQQIARSAALNLDDENVQRLLKVLTENEAEDCAICLEPLNQPSITPCAHYFCKNCIEQVIKTKPVCPMCRRSVMSKDIIELPAPPAPEEDEDESMEEKETVTDGIKRSSKIDGILEILETSLKRDPTTKAVIFSQWSKMLNVIEPFLQSSQINCVRFDGSMTRKRRDANIETFQTDPACNVFLASLKCAGFGLNLTSGNQVYLVDPWWNPTVEDQAVDRVYRLGQTRPVSVFRLVIRNTIEERVMKLQEKKRKLAREAFGEKTPTGDKVRERRMEDLRSLLGGGGGDGGDGAGASGSATVV